MLDLRIRNGRVVDPGNRTEQQRDLAIRDGKMVENDPLEPADQVVNADGCLVTPGLIDYHCHMAWGTTPFGIPADVYLPAAGVTTAVDAGSTGWANFPAYYRGEIVRSTVTQKAMLNVAGAGLASGRDYMENVDPACFNREEIRRTFREYGPVLVGLKLRQSRHIVGDLGLKPLAAAVELGEELNTRLCVHVDDSPGEIEDTLSLLRPGDIFCHVYHNRGITVFREDGGLKKCLFEARERGVLFDASSGIRHYTNEHIRSALRQGFAPDIISTDITPANANHPAMISLPFLLSRYLAFGMDLMEVLAAATSTPHRLIGGDPGPMLEPGRTADVSVFLPRKGCWKFPDLTGDTGEGEILLVPQLTVKAGRILFRQVDLPL